MENAFLSIRETGLQMQSYKIYCKSSNYFAKKLLKILLFYDNTNHIIFLLKIQFPFYIANIQ